MPDTDAYAQGLRDFHHLRESIIGSAVSVLQIKAGSRGLDAGCGIGLPTLMLAEAVGPAGHVTGLDLSPELLLKGRRIAEESGLSERITFQEGNVNRLPFGDNSTDFRFLMT